MTIRIKDHDGKWIAVDISKLERNNKNLLKIVSKIIMENEEIIGEIKAFMQKFEYITNNTSRKEVKPSGEGN